MAKDLAQGPRGKSKLRAAILSWYDATTRVTPGRVGPAARAAGHRPHPYAVWMSEVMLQQTTVAHATPYFETFMGRWPTVADLAAAPDAEVMAAWAGLGYYARARNLLKGARAVVADWGGVFPTTEAELLTLPGVGPYTAAAIAAIAYDLPANAVDGNVERVMSRLYAVETPLPDSKPELKALAAALIADDRPGDWVQALMDLGATVCRPKSPSCLDCPVSDLCAARAGGAPEGYPRKLKSAVKPVRYGAAFVLIDGASLAVEQRESRGLLGGMFGLPTTEWSEHRGAVRPPAGLAGAFERAGTLVHVFTHFTLQLEVWRARGPLGAWRSLPVAEVGRLPSVFKKAARLALSGGG